MLTSADGPVRRNPGFNPIALKNIENRDILDIVGTKKFTLHTLPSKLLLQQDRVGFFTSLLAYGLPEVELRRFAKKKKKFGLQIFDQL